MQSFDDKIIKNTVKYIVNYTLEKLLRTNLFVIKYSSKIFHIDKYCCDSEPKKMFIDLLESDEVEEVHFTGMFTDLKNGRTSFI